jgi:hypothetical protein
MHVFPDLYLIETSSSSMRFLHMATTPSSSCYPSMCYLSLCDKRYLIMIQVWRATAMRRRASWPSCDVEAGSRRLTHLELPWAANTKTNPNHRTSVNSQTKQSKIRISLTYLKL